MTNTIQTPAATAAAEAAEAVQAEEFLYLDPAAIIIGTNVRTDLRPDHKEFRKSIKERGVLEAVTVYRNEDGQYVLLRGQRAELRLVLHDVLAQTGDRMMLVQSRHSVLANLHSMFCKNPGGLKLLGALSEQTLRSVASRISATNLAGRLVQLSSKGLDLYQVKTWVVSSFAHKEVPDSNVIAVRVSLVEFESLYSILEDEGPIQGPLPSAGSKTPIAAPAPDSFSRPGIAVGGDESAFRRF